MKYTLNVQFLALKMPDMQSVTNHLKVFFENTFFCSRFWFGFFIQTQF